MIQYFENKEKIELSPDVKIIDTDYNEKVFINYKWDEKTLQDSVFNSCTFAEMGFKKSKFTHVNFQHSVFIDCYFKDAKFQFIDFTGVAFINCNFSGATFINCEFQYSAFKDCYIEYNSIKSNLPKSKHNLNRDICRNLGLEALRKGDDKEFRRYYLEEKSASEKYHFSKFYHPKSYYLRQKYGLCDNLIGISSFLLSKLNKYLWGYGEQLSRLIINMLLVVIGFAIKYVCLDITNGVNKKINFFDSIYLSLCNFFTISPVSTYNFSKSTLYNFISVTEAGLGVILMGFFIAAIFRYINRRS